MRPRPSVSRAAVYPGKQCVGTIRLHGAEREKRATITKAEGDKLTAFNLAEAAATMLKSPGAMQLHTLQTVDGLGPSASNTVVLYPVDLTGAIQALGDLAKPALDSPA